MKFDAKNPQHDHNDRFVLSKGHAAPLLYAVWAELGLVEQADLERLRKIDCDLEGHPTPRLPFVDVPTGSLGQGICAAIGLALNARRIGSDYRTYVLLGDGESAEGSVWEAAQVGELYQLDNLCAITDVNALGQSGVTQWQHDMAALQRKWTAFGWHTVVVDGHDIAGILAALDDTKRISGQPTMILAKTVKGKGVSFMEGEAGWHGKPIKQGDELDQALGELEQQLGADMLLPSVTGPSSHSTDSDGLPVTVKLPRVPPYDRGSEVATRVAYGTALAALGEIDPRIVALDADVGNSTFSQTFQLAHPKRFYQMYIAEQVMVGAAMGFASRGAIPFPSSFACFLTRAADFIRMAGIGQMNIKLAGSHAGISIGEDGPSQMALEDLAMMRAVPNCTVLYPCDAMSTERLVMAAAAHKGMVYIRTTRPATPVIYGADEKFEIGGSKVIRDAPLAVATIVAAGITVFEALKASDELLEAGTPIRVIDAYSIEPVDVATLVDSARQTGNALITVEDHYVNGGLGDAVSAAVGALGIQVHRLAVKDIPRSGQPDELFDRYGISTTHIVATVRRLIDSSTSQLTT